MIKIDWSKDYRREFTCPHCDKIGMRVRGTDKNGKRVFRCQSCRKHTRSSADLKLKEKKPQHQSLVINWEEDYSGDFCCPKCNKLGMHSAGFNRKKKQFKCAQCKTTSVVYLGLKYRQRYLDSASKYSLVNWTENYNDEFICPNCNTKGVKLFGAQSHNRKRRFRCPNCEKSFQNSSSIKIEAIPDPINPATIWYRGYKIPGFICSECKQENIFFQKIEKNHHNKKLFRCRSCEKRQYDSVFLNKQNLSYFSSKIPQIKPFNFTEDKWDLRSIVPDSKSQDVRKAIVNFETIDPNWYRLEVKKYIYHISKNGISKSFGSINTSTYALRRFANYLTKNNIASFDDIDRSVILDYLAKEKTVSKCKLTPLRSFFIRE